MAVAPTGTSISAARPPTPAAIVRTTGCRTRSPMTTATNTDTADIATVSPNPGEANDTSAKDSPTRPIRAPELQAIFRATYGAAPRTESAASQKRRARTRSPDPGGSASRRPHRPHRPRRRRAWITVHAMRARTAHRTARCMRVADHDGATSKEPSAPVTTFTVHTTTIKIVCGSARTDPAPMHAPHTPTAAIRATPGDGPLATRTPAAAAAAAASHAGVVGIATGSAGPTCGNTAAATAAIRQTDAAIAPIDRKSTR